MDPSPRKYLATPLALALLFAPSLGACTLIDAPEAPGMGWGDEKPTAPAVVNTEQALAPLQGGAYRSSGAFVHATRAPYLSSAVPGTYVDEWVSSDAYSTYSQIDPSVSGSGVTLPVGTTVVRAVLDPTGQAVEKLTVMVKGPSGFNPEVGGWWFAETDPDGAPLITDGGLMAGALGDCATCHLPRASDDFLFGIPQDDRP